MSTAQLAAGLHWHATWVRFLDRSSQPLADHPPVPPTLQRKGSGVRLSPKPCHGLHLAPASWTPLVGVGRCRAAPSAVSHDLTGGLRRAPTLSLHCPWLGGRRLLLPLTPGSAVPGGTQALASTLSRFTAITAEAPEPRVRCARHRKPLAVATTAALFPARPSPGDFMNDTPSLHFHLQVAQRFMGAAWKPGPNYYSISRMGSPK